MRTRFFSCLTAAWVLLTAFSSAQASSLSTAATQMQPGEWRVLNNAGDASGLSTNLLISCLSPPSGDCSDNVLNYADKAMWNPNARTLHFIGQGHGGKELKFLTYSEATNAWSREPKPYWDCSPAEGCYSLVHGYEHSTIDPVSGDIYARKFNSNEVYRWTRTTATWSRLPSAPNDSIVVGLEYFPDAGGLVMVGAGYVHFWNKTTNTWSQLASGLAMGQYHHVASYNAKHKVVIFGGGNDSPKLYRMDAQRTITPLRDAPEGVGILDSVFTVDPASGKQLLLTSSRRMYEYDVPSNTWTQVSTSGMPSDFFASNSYSNAILYRVAAPISTHGVILFIGYDPIKTWIYKHAPGTVAAPDTTPPPAPTGLNVN
ncbi:MAG TPA: hypothetical protein VFS42_07070 [Burkholderiaceae bacterium]|nr:hypothetical protein [Burkholderiaceae bacterium]